MASSGVDITRNGLVEGVPLKSFVTEDKCVPCNMGKQHKKPHKSKVKNSIATPFELLHMDLFGPVNVKSIEGKYYCLVITDDYSRFSWVFFLGTEDETTNTLLEFFSQVENLFRTRVKKIRSDNGTEFKNSLMSVYCLSKGIEH